MAFSIMDHLPADILLGIIGRMNIDTFLAYRVTCRSAHKLIESHIHGLVKDVAQSTFPGQNRLFPLSPAPEKNAPSLDVIRWLQHLRLCQLATISADRDHSEDSSRDDRRQEHLKGWKVLNQLAFIEKEVRRSPSPASVKGNVETNAACTDEEQRLIQQELRVCRNRCQYLETVAPDGMEGAFSVLCTIQYKILGYQGEARHPPVTKRGMLSHKTMSWAMSQALRLGPKTFWRVWWEQKDSVDADHQLVKHKIEEAWLHTTPAVLKAIQDSMLIFNQTQERVMQGHYYAKEVIDKLYPKPRSRDGELEEVFETPQSLSNIPFAQHLSPGVMGEAPYIEPAPEDDEGRRIRRRGYCCQMMFSRPQPRLPEFLELKKELKKGRSKRVWKSLRDHYEQEGKPLPKKIPSRRKLRSM